MKLIIYPDVNIWEFVLSGLKARSDVLLFPLNRNSNLFQRVVRKYGFSLTIPTSFVLGSNLRNALQKLKSGDVVVIAEYTDPILISTIAKIVPEDVSRYIWLWNHKGINRLFTDNLLTIKKLNYQVITYDELDASRFGFRWHTQFFNIRPYHETTLSDNPITYDFFFVGYAKNRVEEIKTIHSMLSSYSCNFVIVQNNSDYIPYTKYMEMAMQARCIVEIVHTGDLACTLRPLEAIAIRRKLLTNNPAVRNYSFYRSQNIFIVGEDDIDNLSTFLGSPFEPLSSEIIDSFDVNSWIDSFL